MSRIGRLPIDIPSGVNVTIDDNNLVTVSGKLGTLSQNVDKIIKVEIKDNQVVLTRPNDESTVKAKHGLYRVLVNNMIKGVTEGFSKSIIINGVGYKATPLITIDFEKPSVTPLIMLFTKTLYKPCFALTVFSSLGRVKTT